MNRRRCTGMMMAGTVAIAAPAVASDRPIQLHCDLNVDPKREQEMLDKFEKVFRPVARRQPGFIDLKMLKLKDPIRGPVPAKYRFELTMASE
jgi:hypothetical protein